MRRIKPLSLESIVGPKKPQPSRNSVPEKRDCEKRAENVLSSAYNKVRDLGSAASGHVKDWYNNPNFYKDPVNIGLASLLGAGGLTAFLEYQQRKKEKQRAKANVDEQIASEIYG